MKVFILESQDQWRPSNLRTHYPSFPFSTTTFVMSFSSSISTPFHLSMTFRRLSHGNRTSNGNERYSLQEHVSSPRNRRSNYPRSNYPRGSDHNPHRDAEQP
ncbi:hypothetical protein LINGRAPRIM_LOCUS2665 [Linum grandiflorum]